jgi:hypothetical protein
MEIADETLLPPMRRSACDVEVQLRKPGDGQPLDPRLDGRRPDPAGAGNPERAAIGEARRSSLASGFAEKPLFRWTLVTPSPTLGVTTSLQ